MTTRLIRRLSSGMLKLLESVLAVLFAALIVDVLLGVVTRYCLGSQVEWTEELACYLLIWMGLVGAAAAFAKKSHLGLDVLVSFFPDSSRRRTEIVSCLVCLAFTLIVFLYGGSLLTLHAFRINRISPSLQLPDGFIFLSLPVSGVFMLVFQLELLLKAIRGDDISDHPESEDAEKV